MLATRGVVMHDRSVVVGNEDVARPVVALLHHAGDAYRIARAEKASGTYVEAVDRGPIDEVSGSRSIVEQLRERGDRNMPEMLARRRVPRVGSGDERRVRRRL